jgi:hypothetical protein
MAMPQIVLHLPPCGGQQASLNLSDCGISDIAESTNVRKILNDYLTWVSQHDVAARVFGHLYPSPVSQTRPVSMRRT